VLIVTPLAVYLLASVPYFAAGHGPLEWLRLQEHMATFGWGVKGDRSFASRPVTWPFDAHPIWYRWSVGPDGTSGLLAIGNFLLWWAGIVAWVVLGLLALLRRDWRLGITPALVAVLYLPWLLTSRQTFIYYMVPVVPFAAVLVATALSRFVGVAWVPPPGAELEGVGENGDRRGRRLAAWTFCFACVATGVLYVPFVVGLPVPFEYYRLLTPFTTWK
jgi:dolichyl-phosphate-mannose--protein O-mannosyl transferase